ncbi:MAG: FKBP-type peptidyl-prolyl cis-trans isomerase [Salibacteraceae bacterium]
MKIPALVLTLGLALLVLNPAVAQKKKKKKKGKKAETEMTLDLNQEHQKAGYSLGVSIATNLKQQGLDSIELNAFFAGLKDAMHGDSTQITPADAQANINAYVKANQEKMKQRAIDKEKAFLEENGQREGVITTPSGLQYEILQKGEGAVPTASSNVTTHYHGMLLDGTVFDSSVNRGQPASFAVNRVIPGWTEALQLMSVGSKYKLYIPFALAYGERGTGGTIPPYATLIFEVELLSVD